MANIEFRAVAHQYQRGKEFALHPMDYEWKQGGAYALLGPSGCGKSTILNILSGLLRPSQGQVFFDGKEMTTLSPQQRNMAQVFQVPVIYETMTVEENLVFPLRNRGVSAFEIRKRVAHVARILELEPFLSQKAAALSPHQKQIVSVGRGIVREDVAAILFDEPLTMIDPLMKGHIRRKLKEIHRELNVTLVYVTHDQTEALTFASSVMVMKEGRILQTASPEELFENPGHPFIGHFIGSPGMNFFNGFVKDDFLEMGPFTIPFSKYATPHIQQFLHKRVIIGCRPRYVEIVEPSASLYPQGRSCTIVHAEDRGSSKVITLLCGETPFKAYLPEGAKAKKGDIVGANFPLEKLRLFPVSEGSEL